MKILDKIIISNKNMCAVFCLYELQNINTLMLKIAHILDNNDNCSLIFIKHNEDCHMWHTNLNSIRMKIDDIVNHGSIAYKVRQGRKLNDEHYI